VFPWSGDLSSSYFDTAVDGTRRERRLLPSGVLSFSLRVADLSAPAGDEIASRGSGVATRSYLSRR